MSSKIEEFSERFLGIKPHKYQLEVIEAIARGDEINIAPYRAAGRSTAYMIVREYLKHGLGLPTGNPAPPAASAPEPELWHLVEVEEEETHILHISGCESEIGSLDPNCRVMADLKQSNTLAIGEYEAKEEAGKIVYTPRRCVELTSVDTR